MALKVEDLTKNVKIERDGRSPLMPQGCFRGILLGSTGCGKTSLVGNMIVKGWLPTNKTWICAHIVEQPIYDHIKDKMTSLVEGINKEIKERNADLSDTDSEEEEEYEIADFLEMMNDPKELPKVEQLEKQNSLIVFDDFITEKKEHELIESFFTKGRHKGISCLFLSQGFFEIPKLIRRNCEYFFVFGGLDEDNLGQLARRIGRGVSTKQFKEIYSLATDPSEEDPKPFLMIDLKTTNPLMKYRRGFDAFIKTSGATIV